MYVCMNISIKCLVPYLSSIIFLFEGHVWTGMDFFVAIKLYLTISKEYTICVQTALCLFVGTKSIIISFKQKCFLSVISINQDNFFQQY